MEFLPQDRNSLFVMAVLYINVLSTTARMESPPYLLETYLVAALTVLKSFHYYMD